MSQYYQIITRLWLTVENLFFLVTRFAFVCTRNFVLPYDGNVPNLLKIMELFRITFDEIKPRGILKSSHINPSLFTLHMFVSRLPVTL